MDAFRKWQSGVWYRVQSIYDGAHYWTYGNIDYETIGYIIVYVVTIVTSNTAHAREELTRDRIWQEIQA